MADSFPSPALTALLLSPVGLGVLGLMIGSFLNVVVHRLPSMMWRAWWQDSVDFQLADAQAWTPLFGARSAMADLEIPPDVPLALLFGIVISLFPAMPFYGWLVRVYDGRLWLRLLTGFLLVLLYVLAWARAFGMPFQPFIYFRF